MSAAFPRILCALTISTLAACQPGESSDGPAAEKEYFVQIQSDAGIEQLCASATKVAAIYTVEGDNPEKIKEWNGTKAAACRAADNRMTMELEHEAEKAKTDALLRANEEAIARMRATR